MTVCFYNVNLTFFFFVIISNPHLWLRGCTFEAGRQEGLGSNPIAPVYPVVRSFPMVFFERCINARWLPL